MFDPYFDSVAAFIAMGEHGFFVWSAYGLSALLIVTNMLVAVRRQGRVRAEIARQLDTVSGLGCNRADQVTHPRHIINHQ